eukprot:3549462-Pyramimonas_sp.AAC.1
MIKSHPYPPSFATPSYTMCREAWREWSWMMYVRGCDGCSVEYVALDVWRMCNVWMHLPTDSLPMQPVGVHILTDPIPRASCQGAPPDEPPPAA